jgi:mono/diheme cytochrome c family protein
MPASKPFRSFGLVLKTLKVSDKVHRLKTLRVSLLSFFFLAFAVGVAYAQGPSEEQLQHGAELFAQNCAVCHGPDGQGRVGATLAKDWPSVRPDLTVKTIIENGVPGSKMPAWSELLTTEDIDALVAYILSWQTGGASNIIILPTPTAFPPITPVPNVEGDPNQGAVLFQENCIMCHGQAGQGKIGKTLARDWSAPRSDLFIKNAIANGTPGSVMPVFGQANGGPLSDTNINDLVAYVFTLPQTGQLQPPTEPAREGGLSWLSGWGGVLVFVLLIAGVFAIILLAQRRSQRPTE